MLRLFLALGCGAIGLMGCTTAATNTAFSGKANTDFSAEIIDLKGKDGPPSNVNHACWQSSVTPAVFETITQQQVVTPATHDPQGKILTPAVFASHSKQSMVSDRKTIWFQSPCPDRISPDFIATLQRALKARGLYSGAITGEMDTPTHQAIGRYQRPRGLNSDKLSLIAARELGLISPVWQR